MFLKVMVMIKEKHKKHKGTAKNTVKRKIMHDDYNQVLGTNEAHKSFNSIRSKKHKIHSINTTKVCLNRYDNKRYWTTSVDSLQMVIIRYMT